MAEQLAGSVRKVALGAEVALPAALPVPAHLQLVWRHHLAPPAGESLIQIGVTLFEEQAPNTGVMLPASVRKVALPAALPVPAHLQLVWRQQFAPPADEDLVQHAVALYKLQYKHSSSLMHTACAKLCGSMPAGPRRA